MKDKEQFIKVRYGNEGRYIVIGKTLEEFTKNFKKEFKLNESKNDFTLCCLNRANIKTLIQDEKGYQKMREFISKFPKFIEPSFISNEPQLQQQQQKDILKAKPKNLSCVQCGMSPIEGIIYKCLICSSYVICSDCEKKFGSNHGHSLLMIRRAEDLNKYSIQMKHLKKGPLVNFSYDCVNNKLFYKTRNNNNFMTIEVNLKNNGFYTWPSPCFLSCLQDESDIKGDRVKMVNCQGMIGQVYNFKIKIDLSGINKSGVYTSVWQVKTENDEAFGPKIIIRICDIFESKLSIKEKYNGFGNNNSNDYRDTLEESIKEIKEKYDILYTSFEIRNALIKTKGNKENAIKILVTEHNKNSYYHK